MGQSPAPHDHPEPWSELAGIDPVLTRGLTEARVSRRGFLAGAGSLGAGALLAACGGVSGTGSKVSTSANTVSAFWAKQHKTGGFVFANWPLYIDVNPNNKNDHPSLDRFTKQTGIKVTYQEVIQDDQSFVGKIEPILAADQPTGYDLMVITNGIYLDRLRRGGWLVPLDHSKLPNFSRYAAPKYHNPPYDPGNTYTVPWQSGFTGIGYNPKLTGREITSFDDLFDPAFKGKVGMFADNQDLPNFALVGIGVDPTKSTPADWRRAAAKLQQQKSAGMVRKYYQQDYIQDLTGGNLALSMAWSGDIFQANQSGAPNLKFVVPKQGGLIWTDNMCIPKGAANPLDALMYMNYCFEPSTAAMMAEGINYITPVPAAKQVIAQDAAQAKPSDRATLDYLKNSTLIFPTAQEYAATYRYRSLTPSEEKVWDTTFEPIYQS